METLRRKWRWVFALVLACAVSLLAWVTQPLEKDLLARATKVAGVKANQDIHPYGWISDRELLLFHFQPDSSWSLARYDLVARKETPLTALSLLYRQSGGDEDGSAPRISLDGKHFLWAGRNNQVFCSDLGGKTGTRQIQRQDWSRTNWLDNTHWAVLKTDKSNTKLLRWKPMTSSRLMFPKRFLLTPLLLSVVVVLWSFLAWRSRRITEFMSC
jgi:hypothetical protein